MRFYNTSYLRFSEDEVRISLDVNRKYFHGEQAVHGSVYFRMLDDAAYFASAAREMEHFLVTKSFNIELLRPVSAGKITAVGTVTAHSKKGYEASATLYDADEKALARGSGIFVTTSKPWAEVFGYSS